MPKKPGRRSAAESGLTVFPGLSPSPAVPTPPSDLTQPGKKLWRDILNSRPSGFYNSGDLVLLAEFVRTTTTLLPRVNALLEEGFDPALLDQRDRLTRLAQSLGRSLRIVVSSRTRADVASMRDSHAPKIIDWHSVKEGNHE